MTSEAVCARSQRYLLRMLQIESKLRRTGVAAIRIDLEAAQDDLLQPTRYGWVDLARRRRFVVEPSAHSGRAGRSAERQLAGSQLKKRDAEREQVAARFVANAEHLFRRDVGRSSHRNMELFGEQVGKVGMVREAEIEQHRALATIQRVRMQQHVAGLHIEMDDPLMMQVLERKRRHRTDRGNARGG